MSPQPAKVVAAGALVWRYDDQSVQVAVVHRPRYDDWSLPKGKVERGEQLPVTAVREVQEETGITVRLGRPLGVQRYKVPGPDGGRVPKVVHYWAAAAPEQTEPFVGDDEVDELEWLSLDAARGRLTWERDVGLLDRLTDGALVTEPLLVVRHAQAVPRKAWDGVDDDDRPLSEVGSAQAQLLVALLSSYAPQRLVSSPAVRCVDTIQPYATANGLLIQHVEALTESNAETHPQRAPTLLQDLVQGGVPALLCTHRPLLPPLLERLGANADVEVADGVLAKGAVLVAHVAAGRVVAVERHRPPKDPSRRGLSR